MSATTATTPPPPIVATPLKNEDGASLKTLNKEYEVRHLQLNICFGVVFSIITLSSIVLISTCLCLTLPGVNAIVLLPGLLPGSTALFIGLCLCLLLAWVIKKRRKGVSELLEAQTNLFYDPHYDFTRKTDGEIKVFIKTHFLIQKNTTAQVNFSDLLHKKLSQAPAASTSSDLQRILKCLEELKKEIPKEAGEKEKAEQEAERKKKKAL